MLENYKLFWKGRQKNQNEQQLNGVGPSDVSLKTFIDQDVQCVDFQIDDSEPRT